MSRFSLIIKQDEEEVDAAEVLVDGMIDGHPYRFLLDTGAARTTLGFDEYTSTFESDEKGNSSGVFAQGSTDLITVPSLEFGSISRKNIKVARTTEQHPDPRNLIGMDLLKDFCCHFFFDENQISMEPKNKSRDSYTFQELFLDDKFHPYIDIQLGELKARAAWDTGAGVTIVDMNIIEMHPAFFQEAGHSTGVDTTGSKMEMPAFIMTAMVIGSYEFPPHKVVGVDLSRMPMDLIIGYSTFRKANWLFDFPHEKWALSKPLGAMKSAAALPHSPRSKR